MKVISFHLKGKMAHFRKFYSNSSALSYYIPPRTTICGIVAGLLGRNRDGYYEEFSLDKFNIAITPCEPMKKTMQKLNYLMIKSQNDLNGSQKHHSQTPMELIIPQNIRTKNIDYKIWIRHEEDLVMDELEDIFMNKDDIYYRSLGACMGLGSAFNLGWIESGGVFQGTKVDLVSEEYISSSIPIDKIREIKVGNIKGNKTRLIKEELPLEFDKDRRITDRGLKNILINLDGSAIPAIVDSFIRLENKENIVWME